MTFKTPFSSALLSLCLTFPAAAKPLYALDKQPLTGKMAVQATADLCFVAKGALGYLNQGAQYDPAAIQPGSIAALGFDLARVAKTLAFICQVQAADTLAGRASRLADPAFINAHFVMIRWTPDKAHASSFAANKPLLQNLPDDQILLTKYYIKLAQGSAVKTAATPHALYAIPHDEQALTVEQADAKKDTLVRYQLTKQQVLSGVIDQNHWADPLLWLSRDDLEDTLMQGTVKVEAEGKSFFFNVHRNNGIGYLRGVEKRQQKRYWYFKPTQGPLGYGKDADYKIPILPYVTVAGDIKNLGLGKLILLSHQGEHRLAILADTGGAFENNQYQLDYLGGYFKNWADYQATYRTFPDYFAARILLVKD